MRYQSKSQLLEDIAEQYATLQAVLDEIDSSRYEARGVWGDDWTLGDLLSHLAEWHGMLLRWFAEGQGGRRPEMPAPGYKWNETPRLNRAIQEKHSGRSGAEAREAFESSHGEVVALVQALTEKDLFERGRLEWTGRSALVTYVGANTASHYRFALKVIKRWQRQSTV